MSIGNVIVRPTPTADPLIAPITGLRLSKIRSASTPPASRGTDSMSPGPPSLASAAPRRA